MDAFDIVTHGIAFFIGGGVGISIKVVMDRSNHSRINRVNQRNISAGGDVAGGSIKKNR